MKKFAVLSQCLPILKDEWIEPLDMPIVEEITSEDAWLSYESDKLCLNHMSGLSFSLDWGAGAIKQRIKTFGKRQPLARAVGVGKIPIVLDATGGFGLDSLAIASQGVRVITVEINPLVYLVLCHARNVAIKKGMYNLTAENYEIRFGDFRAIYPTLNITSPFSIYYDPMYPPKKKSAIPKKEMQILSLIAENACSVEEMLDFARRSDAERVAVKRPPWADPSLMPVNFSVESKLVRYDIYQFSRS